MIDLSTEGFRYFAVGQVSRPFVVTEKLDQAAWRRSGEQRVMANRAPRVVRKKDMLAPLQIGRIEGGASR